MNRITKSNNNKSVVLIANFRTIFRANIDYGIDYYYNI